MSVQRLHKVPRLVMLAAAGLLFADLFLGWQEASSSTGMYVNATAGGWHGSGAIVGLLLMTVLVRDLLGVAGASTGLIVNVLIASGIVALTVARLQDSADTTIGLTTVAVGANRWPAWVGLGLALILAAAALVAFVLEFAVQKASKGGASRPAMP